MFYATVSSGRHLYTIAFFEADRSARASERYSRRDPCRISGCTTHVLYRRQPLIDLYSERLCAVRVQCHGSVLFRAMFFLQMDWDLSAREQI